MRALRGTRCPDSVWAGDAAPILPLADATNSPGWAAVHQARKSCE